MGTHVLNRAEREALARLYARSPSGHASYRSFRRTAWWSAMNGCLMVPWCAMTVGIEADGHTHS